MIRLSIGNEQQIDQPTSEAIANAIAALDSGAQPFVNVAQTETQDAFAKAIRLEPGLFLLEYSDSYGHMAADEPLDGDTLAEILNAYVRGDATWVKRFSWAPVEM